MDISIIGSGNVASHLGPALSSHFNIKYVLSSILQSATELSDRINALPTEDYHMIKAESDVILVCVPDDLIIEISYRLKSCEGNPIIAHVSGSVPAELLSQASINYGVFYPLQTFTKNEPLAINEVPFFINGNSKKVVQTLSQIAEKISSKVFVLDDEKRLHLHIAAVMVNNFTNHLFYQTEKFLDNKNLKLEYFDPLIRETIKKMQNIGPYKAQTGPAKRQDQKVIESHLEYLKTDKDLYNLYSTFSQLIMKTYENN